MTASLEALGLTAGAQPADIEAAYKRLAFEHHPDRGGSAAKMTELNAARNAALAVHLSAAHLATLHDQARHYAAVRARLWPLALRATKQEPLKPAWSTPTLTSIVQSDDERIASAVRIVFARERVSVRGIAETVAATFDLTFEDLTSSSRKLRLIAPRHLAMAIARTRLSHSPRGSLPAIGRVFGGRDHTTVLHAARKYGPVIERLARLTTNGASS